MRKAKYAISLILCIIIGITLFTGCAGGGGGNTEQPAQTAGSGAAEPPSQTTGGGTVQPSVSSSSPSPVAIPENTDAPVSEDAEYYEHFTFLLNGGIQILDLFNPASSSSQIGYVTNHVYNRLVKVTPTGEFLPDLALSWETDDYITINLKLRDDVYFHNGEKFTADDVAFTIESSWEATGTRMFDRWSKVDSYEVVNDYEINIVFKQMNIDYLYDFSNAIGAILNRKAYADDPEKGPWIGTGPWIVTDFKSLDSIDFIRNENYFGQIPVTKTMTFRTIAEITAKNIMIENDEADLTNLDSAYIPMYENDDRFTLWSYTMNNLNYCAFNFNNPITADYNFRMAIAHAFNAEECLDISLNGYGLPADLAAAWGLYTEFRNNDLPAYEYNLDLAKDYLSKSSYNGETVQVINMGGHGSRISQVIQAQAGAIGINIEVFDTDSPTLNANTMWGNTDSQLIVTSIVQPAASDIRSYIYPGYSANKSNYDNPRVNELLDLASATLDRAEREKMYREVQEILATELPYLPVLYMSLYFIGQNGIGGMQWYPDNNHDLSQVYRLKLP